MRSVIPWSWSSYEAYVLTCPRRFYELRIAKNFVEPESQPLIWGNEVHKAIELYLTTGRPLPDIMQRFKGVVDRIASAPGDKHVEMELACDINYKPTGFWSDNAWCRGKGDLVIVNDTRALNVDWKTGKWKDGSLQLDVMSLLTFAKFPAVEKVTTLFMYFQDPTKPVSKTFYREEFGDIAGQFSDGVNDMLYSEQTGVWPERPSGLCKQHCPVTTCQYHGKGKPRWKR